VSGKIARGGPPILRFIAFLLTSFSKICLGGAVSYPPPPLTPLCASMIVDNLKSVLLVMFTMKYRCNVSKVALTSNTLLLIILSEQCNVDNPMTIQYTGIRLMGSWLIGSFS
jgi:hypothetical protein